MSEKGFRPPYEVEAAAERLNLTKYQVRHAFKRGELGGFVVRTGVVRMIRFLMLRVLGGRPHNTAAT